MRRDTAALGGPPAARLFGVLYLFLACGASSAMAQEASGALYVRTDTDYTTVITPRARLALPLGEATTVDVVYTADVWTSASIDIRTSASKNVRDLENPDEALVSNAIDGNVKPVTERRDEINVALAQVVDNLTLNSSYRYSNEPDYTSHGGSVGFALDLAQRASTLTLDVGGSLDRVGKADDPQFDRGVSNLSARFGLTQVLTPDLLVQGVYELINNHGYLASPYRYVSPGTYDSRCRNYPGFESDVCFPERVPADRLRHALALTGRQALGDHFSFGATYRFYIDSWSLLSHTAQGELAFAPDQSTLIALGYRYYQQSNADFYQAQYLDPEAPVEGEYYTNDKELSPIRAHRISLDLERTFEFDSGEAFRVLASVAPTFYQYTDFVPYESITAFEATMAVVFQP